MMEPHMIENYILYVFVFEFNHMGFICSYLKYCLIYPFKSDIQTLKGLRALQFLLSLLSSNKTCRLVNLKPPNG
jgi:hypothetical protein